MKLPIQASPAERWMASGLLLLLLFLFPALDFLVLTWRSHQAWPLLLLMLVLVAIGVVIARGVYRRNRRGWTARAWSYAFASAGLAYAFYGAIILTTGRLPNKYDPRRVPRADSIREFAVALTCAAASGAFLLASKPKRPG